MPLTQTFWLKKRLQRTSRWKMTNRWRWQDHEYGNQPMEACACCPTPHVWRLKCIWILFVVVHRLAQCGHWVCDGLAQRRFFFVLNDPFVLLSCVVLIWWNHWPPHSFDRSVGLSYIHCHPSINPLEADNSSVIYSAGHDTHARVLLLQLILYERPQQYHPLPLLTP
jgi:hypothetical protein